ncbi:hypothetical protein ACWDX6_25695 [Streptomyces sp. NPDC003027]
MTYELVGGDLPLRLPGTFKPWAIEVGHSKVLLRGLLGGEDGGRPRMFDVLFQDVSRISLSDRYTDLAVHTADPETMRAEERRVGGRWRGSHLFLLSETNPCDYVVAGYLFWAEVNVFPGERSPLLEESPQPGSIVGNRVFRV